MNEKVQTGKNRRPRTRDGAWFERSELVGVFPVRATRSREKITEAALPTWRPVQFIFCCRYFPRLHGHFRRKNNLGNNAEAALRAVFWFAMGSSPVCVRLRRKNNDGKTGKEATPLT